MELHQNTIGIKRVFMKKKTWAQKVYFWISGDWFILSSYQPVQPYSQQM